MKVWLRRLGFTVFIMVWLVIMACPTFTFFLIRNQQLTWGDNPNDQIRLFVMQEVGNEGLGIQWTRPADDEANCIRTSVRYLMLAGDADNNDVCLCMTEEGELPDACQISDP